MVAVVVVFALISGCARRGGNIALLAVGGGIALGAVTQEATAPSEGDDFHNERSTFRNLGLLIALPFILAGTVGLLTMKPAAADDDADDEEAAPSPVVRPTPSRSAQARELTEAAISAAGSNQCEMVRELEVKVRSMDASVHARVLMVDVDVKRCIEAAATKIEPAPLP